MHKLFIYSSDWAKISKPTIYYCAVGINKLINDKTRATAKRNTFVEMGSQHFWLNNCTILRCEFQEYIAQWVIAMCLLTIELLFLLFTTLPAKPFHWPAILFEFELNNDHYCCIFKCIQPQNQLDMCALLVGDFVFCL